MKKIAKRYISLFLVLAVILSGMAACSGQKKEEAGSDIKKEASANPFEKKIEISWLGKEGQEIADGNWVQKKLEEKFNIKLVNKKIDVNNKEVVNLMLASGEMPDACYLTNKDPMAAYKEGLTRSFSKEVLLKYAPGYAKMLDENPTGWLMHKVPGKESEYMCLTGVANYLEQIVLLPHYRLDWLENLGLAPAKEDMEALDEEKRVWFTKKQIRSNELEDILYAFTFKDPDGNGKKDTFGMTACADDKTYSWGVLEGMFGFQDGFNLNYNGEFCEWNISPPYKDFLKLMNQWHKRGIVDPEFIVMNRSKMWEKITNGMAGYWIGPHNYMDYNAPTFATRPPVSVLKKDPKAKLLIRAPEIGPDGKSGSRQWSPVGPLNYNFVINTRVNDEKLNRILQIFDYVNFDKEAYVWTRYGNEGEHFQWNGQPYDYKAGLTLNKGVKNGADTGLLYYTHVIDTRDNVPLMYGPIPNKMLPWTSGEGFKNFAIRPYKWDYFNETNLSSVNSQYGADLNTILNEFFLKAITGEINVDAEWDKYVQKWKSAGGDKVMEELKKAPLVEELRKGVNKK